MARFRALVSEDQVARVGDLTFRRGQLLPEGTMEYQVLGQYELEPHERWAGAKSKISYSFPVPVGASSAAVEEATDFIVQTFIEDKIQKGSPNVSEFWYL